MKHRMVPNLEWGRRGRKDEDRLRNLNGSDRRAEIEEQLTELADENDNEEI